jgi:carboxypeptidase A4
MFNVFGCKMFVLLSLAFCFLLALNGGAQARDLGVESDSGIRGPAYRDLVQYFSGLQTRYPQFVQVNTFGQSIQGRPLVVIRISYQPAYWSALRPRHQSNAAVLVTGTTHGDEYLNIEDRLPEWFAKEGVHAPEMIPFFKNGGMIYFVPIVNPDGYESRRRSNANGKDLNRDFTLKIKNHIGFKETETKALRDLMLTQLQVSQQRLVLTLDYHCCIGAALYPWSFEPAPVVPDVDLRRMLTAADVIKRSFGSSFPVGRTPDVLGYNAIGTSKDYYYESLGAVSFTFEGEYVKEQQKFSQHILMWKGLIQALAPTARIRQTQ